MGPDGAAVLVLTKRARACRKKLSRVQELEAASAQGKVLTSEQLPILASKPGLVAVLDELSKLEEAVREAVKEERAEARQDGFTAGLQEGQESERQRSEHELLELREQLNAERDQHAAELEAARQQHAAELEARDAEHEQKLPAAIDAAVSAAVEAVQAKPSAPDAEQLKELLREPLMKIIQLFYFSQLFDSFRNPWVAASEVPACLNYDTHLPPSESSPPLVELDLGNVAYLGRILLDRMDKVVSHQEFLAASLEASLEYLFAPDATAIPSPPALAPITMGEVSSRLGRILASDFTSAVPTRNPPPAPPAAPVPGPAPGPVLGFPAPSALQAAVPSPGLLHQLAPGPGPLHMGVGPAPLPSAAPPYYSQELDAQLPSSLEEPGARPHLTPSGPSPLPPQPGHQRPDASDPAAAMAAAPQDHGYSHSHSQGPPPALSQGPGQGQPGTVGGGGVDVSAVGPGQTRLPHTLNSLFMAGGDVTGSSSTAATASTNYPTSSHPRTSLDLGSGGLPHNHYNMGSQPAHPPAAGPGPLGHLGGPGINSGAGMNSGQSFLQLGSDVTSQLGAASMASRLPPPFIPLSAVGLSAARGVGGSNRFGAAYANGSGGGSGSALATAAEAGAYGALRGYGAEAMAHQYLSGGLEGLPDAGAGPSGMGLGEEGEGLDPEASAASGMPTNTGHQADYSTSLNLHKSGGGDPNYYDSRTNRANPGQGAPGRAPPGPRQGRNAQPANSRHAVYAGPPPSALVHSSVAMNGNGQAPLVGGNDRLGFNGNGGLPRPGKQYEEGGRAGGRGAYGHAGLGRNRQQQPGYHTPQDFGIGQMS
ncbi:hypothetical protein V8C86DRAFT_2678255 [Haematococcus lacustris]